jgi:hypothetical protein
VLINGQLLIPQRYIPGLFGIGAHPARMVKAPFRIPEVPIPATARPTISIFEELDTPQINEPSSKSTKKARKVHLDTISHWQKELER